MTTALAPGGPQADTSASRRIGDQTCRRSGQICAEPRRDPWMILQCELQGIILDVLHRDRHQPLADARSVPLYPLAGGIARFATSLREPQRS